MVRKHSDLALLQWFKMPATKHVEFSSLQVWLRRKTPICSNVYDVKWLMCRKKCLHILYVEINTWKSTKNVNNSILEWNSLLIPRHLNDILPLQMAEHTTKKLMLLLPFCTLVITDETLLQNMQWKLIYCLTFVTLSKWWLTSKHSHY